LRESRCRYFLKTTIAHCQGTTMAAWYILSSCPFPGHSDPHFLLPNSCRSVYCPTTGISSPRHLLEYQGNSLSPLRNSLHIRAGGAGHFCPLHVPHMSWTRPLTSLRCPSHVLDTFSHFPHMALTLSNVKASLVSP